MRVETISARNQIRFYCLFGVAHSAVEAMQPILSGIEAALRASDGDRGEHQRALRRAHGLRAKHRSRGDGRHGRLRSVSQREIGYDTQSFAKFMELRQAYLLQIIAAVHAAGGALAHPVRSVELAERALREPGKGLAVPTRQ